MNLTRATFGDHAGFDGATFGDDARFGGATFGDDARFGGATFAPGRAAGHDHPDSTPNMKDRG